MEGDGRNLLDYVHLTNKEKDGPANLYSRNATFFLHHPALPL